MQQLFRILVLEDDLDLRGVLEEVLRDRGFYVVSSGRGSDAVAQAGQEVFDLILADIRMDGMTGLDAIEAAQRLQPQVGAIVISGYASEEETLRAVRLKVAGYLKKPFKIQELMALINDFVTRRTQQIRLQEQSQQARQALIWCLGHLQTLGEKLHPGRVNRVAELTTKLAQLQNFSAEVSVELGLTATLRQLAKVGALSLPERLAVDLLPSLNSALHQPDSTDFLVVEAVLKLASQTEADSPWPVLSELPAEFPEELKAAYQASFSSQALVASATPHGAGLLNLARTLEQTGDFEGAARAYEELLAHQSHGLEAMQAWLGLARLSLAGGQREALEQHLRNALAQATKLGPLRLALAELEAAEISARASHPAAARLFARAAHSLGLARLPVSQARAWLRLNGLGGEAPPDELAGAVSVLSDPMHLSEVFEQVSTLFPDVLLLAWQNPQGPAARLARRWVQDYPQEILDLLRSARMRPEFCDLVLSSLEEQGTAAGELVQFFRATPEFAERAARISEGAPAPMVLKIYSLGISQVQVGEEWIADSSWKTQKVKSVFFYLAAQDGRAVVVDNLLEEFWPDSGEAARANLNTAASSIRRTLRSAREVAGPDPILRIRESIGINPDCPRWHDVEELEKAYQAGCRAWEEGQLDVGVLQFTRVAQLYRGPYLEGIYMDWALRRRTSIERIVGEALERLTDSCLDQKSFKEALEYSQRLLELRPESVEAHHAKMRAHLGLEEHTLVAQQFESCRKMMEEMYSTPPPTELLKTLYQSRYGLAEPSAKI